MNVKQCGYDPVVEKSGSNGMYHCPECGQMVLAGMPHPPYWNMNDDYWASIEGDSI